MCSRLTEHFPVLKRRITGILSGNTIDMKTLVPRLVMVGVLVSAGSFAARAVTPPPLAVAPVSLRTGDNAIFNSLIVWVSYAPVEGFEPRFQLFENFELTVADVGRTFTATAQTDPDFGGFVSLLTNGNDDIMMLGTSNPFSGAGFLESSAWTQLPPSSNGLDLRGFPVRRITLTVDSLSINTPGENPNGDGNWTDRSFSGTLKFYTTVPEPTTFALLSLGVLGAILKRRQAL